jgi:hypothetical protein
VITGLSSGNISFTPATRERPRIVAPEAIAVFERNNPALKGIGSIMVDLGIWILDENSEAEIRGAHPPKACTSVIDTVTTRSDDVSGDIFTPRIY